MKTRLTPRRSLAWLSIAAAAALIPVAPAFAQQAPPVTDIGPGGGPIPLITPTVSCAIRTHLIDTYWFGYANSSISSITVPVGSNNKIPRTVFRQTFNDAAQPDQFKPGTIAQSVAVQVAHNASATWTISGPSTDPASPVAATASATASSTTPACPAGTPLVSANLRVGGVQISYVPETQTRDASGLLSQASVRFVAPGIRTVCSLGGIPSQPTLLWGWVDEFGVPASTRPAFYAPLAPGDIVRTDTFSGLDRFNNPLSVSYQRTNSSIRTITNPQALTSQFASSGQTFQQYGWSLVVPTVDASGFCRVGKTKIAAPNVFVGGGEGGYSYSITDPATQTTRPPVFCVFGSATCEVLTEITGPGGARVQR